MQSSTQQQGSYFALTSAAVHWSCITAHLYEGQMSTSVIAVAQGCREASLQRSTEQQASYIAKTSAALHWSCITAQPYEQQTFIGVTALAQACREPFLQSRTEQWGLHFAQGRLQCIGVGSLLSCMKSKPS